MPYDVRREFEVSQLKHIGAVHMETGIRSADAARRASTARLLVQAIAKGWAVGAAHGRGRTSGVDIPTRLQ
eukprot:2677637-Pyramimonas_sp.AAC.1